MKIGIVCYPTYGGSGAVATNLAIKLSLLNHQVHLISYQKPFRLKERNSNIFFHKVKFINYPLLPYPDYTFSLASKIYNLIKDYKLEIVHLHYFIPHHLPALLILRSLKEKINSKIIVTLHGTDTYLLARKKELKRLAKDFLASCDGVTTVSFYLKNYLQRYFFLEKEIKVIPNFVDPKEYTPLNQSFNHPYLIHISNFRPIKNIPDIVKAFKIINEHKESFLLLIGEGPEKEGIKNLVKRLNLNSKVIFHKGGKEVNRLIAKGTIFILASLMESFGLAALEAMSCGLPVVGYRVGGLKEVISHKENGFLVKKGDVEELAKVSLKLLEDKELLYNFGETSRKIALSKFNIDNIVKEYEDYYLSLLDNR